MTAARGIGNRIAPARFLLFIAITAAVAALAVPLLGLRYGAMIGFDAGAMVFLLSCLPMLRDESEAMRKAARRNDANRLLLLLITLAVSLVVLAAVASILMEGQSGKWWSMPLVIATLVLSWTFSNTIYALHYAHLFYTAGRGKDAGGLTFPETKEPDYWDFLYFAFCLGMTFQTSDVEVTQGRLRKPVTLHCLAAFVFNLGVIAFTINVLGS
ncbi:DUF1345 domain-containing protein [Sphingomonas soli]|uniref:DUF1345 domain-containing protein n=1 Tax=Sphingomonas soli TaxID=266127 RepID=UPI000A6363F9|nr:DUF1345 domain-containing protein [Sphingomonas soli]